MFRGSRAGSRQVCTGGDAFRPNRLRAHVLAAFVLILPLARPVWADDVTLEKAYLRMIQGGIETGIIDADLLAAAEVVNQAKGQRRPRVALTFEYDKIRQNVLSSDNTAYATGASQYPKMTVALTVTQPLYDAVAFRQLPLAKAQKAAADAEAAVAVNKVVRDLITAFLEVGQAQIKVSRAKAVVAARVELERSLKEQIDAGRKDADVLIRAEGETFAARNDQSDAEIALAEALAGLQRYAGADVTGVSMDGNRIGVVDLGNLDQTLTRERLLDMSPDLQAARAALDVANRTVRVAKGASQPSANVVLDMEQEKTEGSLFGGGSDTQTTSLGMAFSVPIYNGGINKSRVREAEAKVKGATLRVKQTEAAVLSHYDALMKAAKSTAQRTGSISRQLNLVEQSLKAATEQVASGRASDDVRLEQALRRDVTRLDLQAARLQQLRIQSELYALFGALDVKALSGQAG